MFVSVQQSRFEKKFGNSLSMTEYFYVSVPKGPQWKVILCVERILGSPPSV